MDIFYKKELLQVTLKDKLQFNEKVQNECWRKNKKEEKSKKQ